MVYKRGQATYSDGSPIGAKPKAFAAKRRKKVAVGAPLPSASYNRPPRLV